jgi:hypothetical protein
MKRFVFFIVAITLFSSCNLLDDWWYAYYRKPHHSFHIVNNTNKELYKGAYLVGSPKSEYSCFEEDFIDLDLRNPPVAFFDETIYFKDGEIHLDVRDYCTRLYVGFFNIRLEDVQAREDGSICCVIICYKDDLYDIYNGKTDRIRYWIYSYTLEDLQRYNWNVPFPDESGTIKIEQFEYTVKDYTVMTYDDILGNY